MRKKKKDGHLNVVGVLLYCAKYFKIITDFPGTHQNNLEMFANESAFLQETNNTVISDDRNNEKVLEAYISVHLEHGDPLKLIQFSSLQLNSFSLVQFKMV